MVQVDLLFLSSVLHSAAYEQATRVLTLVFKTGKTYDYAGVPLMVYQALVTAKSPGTYYSRNIKGKYKAPEETP
jgi:hypothetical protein